MLSMGMPVWQVDALLDLQRYYTNGQGGEVTEVLPQLLRRPPKKILSFLEEFETAFALLCQLITKEGIYDAR